MPVTDIDLVGRCVRSWGTTEQIAAWDRLHAKLIAKPTAQTKLSAKSRTAKMPRTCYSCRVGCRGVLTYGSDSCMQRVMHRVATTIRSKKTV